VLSDTGGHLNNLYVVELLICSYSGRYGESLKRSELSKSRKVRGGGGCKKHSEWVKMYHYFKGTNKRGPRRGVIGTNTVVE